MEGRKGKRSRAKAEAGIPPASEVVAELIPFDQWFGEQLKTNPKLKPWQFKELQVFMKSRGLADREDREAYNQAFNKY